MKRKIQTVCAAWGYIPWSDVGGRHLGILQVGDNVSNTRKNKVNVDLEF